MEHAAIELHDSTLERVERDGDDLVLTLSAYVHRSKGAPGVDAGSGFSQLAEVRLRGGRATGVPGGPIVLGTGTAYVGAHQHRNLVPAPLDHAGAARIELFGQRGEHLVVEGASLHVTLVGESEYVEEFPGAG